MFWVNSKERRKGGEGGNGDPDINSMKTIHVLGQQHNRQIGRGGSGGRDIDTFTHFPQPCHETLFLSICVIYVTNSCCSHCNNKSALIPPS